MASGGPRRPARSAALPGFALLAEATRALGTLDLGRLVNRLTELTRANLAADAAGVWLLERGGSELVLHSGAGFKHPEVVTRLTQAPGRDVLGWIVDRPGPVAVRDLRAAARPEVRRWIESEEFGAFLGVPLVGDATPLGMLGLFRRGRRIFTAADLALTRTLCLPAAPAIVNARLHAELAQQAAVATEQARQHGVSVRRAGELEALLRAVRTMLSGLDTKTILDSIVQEASAIAGTSQVALRLLDRASGSLRVAALAGSSTPSDVATPPGERHSAEVTRSGQLFADDTCLGLPVKIRGTVLGVLCFTTAAPRRYSAEELAHLGSFADHAAIALDNARLYEDAQRAISDLHVMQRRLVQGETLRALGELAGGGAHHLNNLLTIVVGRIQLLRRTVTEERLLRPLEIVEHAAKDGAEVVRRLQQFAGMRRVSEPHSVDLNQIVMDVIEISRPQWQDPSRAEGTEIVVESRLAPLPEIAGDPISLREMVSNLVLNAIDALPRGGRLSVQTGATDAAITLTVTDTGLGMSEVVRLRAHEPFFTTKGVKSTGLGLSVAFGVTRRHGGELAIQSEPGQGTTVRITLPVHYEPGDPAARGGPPR